MSFLLDFIRALTEEEIAKLNSMPLTGREDEVLTHLVKHRLTKGNVDKNSLKLLHLSASHYDKINSVLLEKSITHLCGTDIASAFNLFCDRNLMDLLFHEIKITERQLLKKKPLPDMSDFYRKVLFVLRRVGTDAYDEEKLMLYAKRYLQSLPTATLEDEAEVYLMCLLTRIFYHAVTGGGPAFEPTYKSEIAYWEDRLAGKQLHRANFQFWLCKASYYDFYSHDDNNLLLSNQNALDEMELAGDAVPENMRIYATTKMAKAYTHCNRFADALLTYRDVFKRWPKSLSNNRYHIIMYGVIALINKELNEAEEVLERLKYILGREEDKGMQLNLARNLALVYLNKKKFDEAWEMLTLTMQLPRADTDLLNDILNRVVHNCYFALTGEWETAARLLNANKKFLVARKDNPMTVEYDGFFNMLKAVIRFKQGKAKLPADFESRISYYRNGFMNLYGNLLDQMLA
ncbi:MAG: hypothetical protein U0T75_05250 [Chitinophagales bacterium]